MAEIKGERDENLTQTFVGGGLLNINFSYNLLAFDFSPANDGADWFRVLLDGTQFFSASINALVSTWSNTGWLSVSHWTPVLAVGSHTLEFCIDTTNAATTAHPFECGGGNAGSLNPALLAYVDNVEVAVPEPGSLLLLAAGLLGLARTTRRRASR